MSRRVALSLLPAVALAVLAMPAEAKHRKPITKTYSVTALPYPASSAANLGGCFTGQEGIHKDTETFTVPDAGLLKVTLSDFQVDWDLFLFDGKGRSVAISNSADGGKETVSYKRGKRGEKLQIVACNWAGSPTAKVTYTFTFAR